MRKPTKVSRLLLSMAAAVALLTGPSNGTVQAQWYWDDAISTCVDPCPFYIAGLCWCSKLPPIIIT